MKTNKIVSEHQFNMAKLCKSDSCVYQNNKSNWIIFGTYGCTIQFSNKCGSTGEKHINDWRRFSYLDFCKSMDSIDL